MPMIASDLLDPVAATLLDTAHRTWSFDDLMGYLTEALRATAGAKPNMYVVQAPFTVAAGVLQTIPSDGVALFNITRNIGGRNRVVTEVNDDLLEEANRFWPNATQQAEVEHYTADPRTPLHFRVFPPNDGTGNVEIVYGAVPPPILYPTQELLVTDSFQAPLTNFVLSRAYAKNSKRQDLAKASYYMQQWAAFVGLKSQAMLAVAPRVSQSQGE